MFVSGFVPKKAPLVFNGGFENAPPFTAAQTGNAQWINGTASGGAVEQGRGWMAGGVNANNTVQFDPTDKNSGNYSLKLVIADATSAVEIRSNNVSLTYGTPLGTGFPLAPSANYRLTWWMKISNVAGDSNNGATVQLLSADATGTNVHGYDPGYFKANQPWTKHTLNFTTAADDRLGHIELRWYGQSGTGTLTGTVWWDDIVVKRV